MSIDKQKVGLALSGGGSRAIAFHYGVFESLHTLKVDKKIDVISSISGGSIIAALWNLYSRDWNIFTEKVEIVLREGLESAFIKKLCNVRWLISKISNFGLDPDGLADILDEKVFNNVKLNNIPDNPLLILNASEIKTGSNFKLSKKISGSYKTGNCTFTELLLSQAVAYSAAYPLMFSVKKVKINENISAYLSDGGAYDCLGANALMPDKVDEISILTQNCETIITSDASAPFMENRENLNRSIIDGLYASYLTSGHRNKSLIYNKLYLLNQSGKIPYLGTIKMDSRHPDLKFDWTQDDLNFIYNYPTNFKPVTGRALELLKKRGKESTDFIVTTYLKHLL